MKELQKSNLHCDKTWLNITCCQHPVIDTSDQGLTLSVHHGICLV